MECSGIVKDVSSYNDSRVGALGAAWARHRWYGRSYLVFPNGTLLSGNDGDDYSNK